MDDKCSVDINGYWRLFLKQQNGYIFENMPTIKKSEGILLFPTLKVHESQVPLFSSFFAYFSRYDAILAFMVEVSE